MLKAIRKWTPDEPVQYAVRGQYRGYLEEKGVPPESVTATYAARRLFVDNWRWQGVPFYLRSGKGLNEKVTEIVIQFKPPPHVMFPLGTDEYLRSNTIAMRIQPDEGVHLNFQVKVPDRGIDMEAVDMEFHYESAFKGQVIPEAYERLLQDALEGDASLFIRSDHIEEAWRIVDPMLQAWEDPESIFPLHLYEPGSWGPKAADTLLTRDGRMWAQNRWWPRTGPCVKVVRI